jgi:hypothetical protein
MLGKALTVAGWPVLVAARLAGRPDEAGGVPVAAFS